MCSYCIVPFTRGRERSRPVASILDEVSPRKLEIGMRELPFITSTLEGGGGLESGRSNEAQWGKLHEHADKWGGGNKIGKFFGCHKWKAPYTSQPLENRHI